MELVWAKTLRATFHSNLHFLLQQFEVQNYINLNLRQTRIQQLSFTAAPYKQRGLIEKVRCGKELLGMLYQQRFLDLQLRPVRNLGKPVSVHFIPRKLKSA
jgi:hypothetical protein